MKRAHFKHKKQENKQNHKISIFIVSDLKQRQKQESNRIPKKKERERENGLSITRVTTPGTDDSLTPP